MTAIILPPPPAFADDAIAATATRLCLMLRYALRARNDAVARVVMRCRQRLMRAPDDDG